MDTIKLYKTLQSDCANCLGFCCRALYFAKGDGFPETKNAGTPCSKLASDYRCIVHDDLTSLGLKGCRSYECFGSGQKAALLFQDGMDDKQRQQLDMVFHKLFEIHEMLWYLCDAYRFSQQKQEEIDAMAQEIQGYTMVDMETLAFLDVDAIRKRVNVILRAVSDAIRGNKIGKRKNHLGENLSKHSFSKEDYRGSLMIAANLKDSHFYHCDFIAADFRDCDVRGTDISTCLFLTQAQMNAAKGDKRTKLPPHMKRPTHWL